MGNYTGGATTICPYYSHESDKTITCEGMIEDTYVMSRFKNNETKVNWQCQSCSTFKYNSCPIADANNKRFGINDSNVVIFHNKVAKKEIIQEDKPKIKSQIKGQITLDYYFK